jgi:hypothetical protein
VPAPPRRRTLQPIPHRATGSEQTANRDLCVASSRPVARGPAGAAVPPSYGVRIQVQPPPSKRSGFARMIERAAADADLRSRRPPARFDTPAARAGQ